MINRRVVEKSDEFDYPYTYSTTPGGTFGWTIADTSAAGAPTYLNTSTEDGGAAGLTLASTSEIENVCLYQNDVLMYDWATIQYIEFIVKGLIAFTSGDTLFFGLSSARNDAIASISEIIAFKLVAATSLTAVVIDTKDGTTAVTNTATGGSLLTTYQKFAFDFSNGLGDVRAFINGARVAAGTTFNLAAITAGHNAQLIVQLQKTATASVSNLEISRVKIQYRVAEGA
jgi:hypothetical protein